MVFFPPHIKSFGEETTTLWRKSLRTVSHPLCSSPQPDTEASACAGEQHEGTPAKREVALMRSVSLYVEGSWLSVHRRTDERLDAPPASPHQSLHVLAWLQLPQRLQLEPEQQVRGTPWKWGPSRGAAGPGGTGRHHHRYPTGSAPTDMRAARDHCNKAP